MMSICFILFLLISILTTSYGQVTCASGWVQNGGKCYLFGITSPYSWDQCNAYCTTATYPGAMMLCVNNAAENAWMRAQIQPYGNWNWIGYTDMLPYGGGKGTKQYGWVTGCSSTYTNWVAGSPDNNDNNEDYAAIHPNDGKWLDYPPQNNFFCGCEYNPALTRTPSSGPTSSPTATPSFRASMGDVHE